MNDEEDEVALVVAVDAVSEESTGADDAVEEDIIPNYLAHKISFTQKIC